jgi:hypothetical protein
LVAAVSRGHVGIVLADEARRRAHNHAEWSELRDRAALVGALSAVAEARRVWYCAARGVQGFGGWPWRGLAVPARRAVRRNLETLGAGHRGRGDATVTARMAAL